MTHHWTRRARRTLISLSRTALLTGAVLLSSTVCHAAPARTTTAIPYSALKAHVAAGDVQDVRLSPTWIEAVPTDAARKAGAPSLWTALPIPDDPSLVALLDAHHVTYEGLDARPSAAAPLVALLCVSIVGLALFGIVRWRQKHPASDRLDFGQARLRDARGRSSTKFHDVAGVDEAREELEEVVHFLRHPKRFAAIGARVPKGVLLVGPPGTGKTLLAKAVAGEADVPFFAMSGSEFLEMYVGVGASRVRKLFKKARAQAPAIVFIDELDAVGKTRSGGQGGANDEREHTLNQLLVELDGFDGRDGIVVMAATNRADALDAALLRPGRFDRQVMVDRPDGEGREAILRVHARRLALGADVDLAHVAQRTVGFVGADLENVLNEAALLAARADKQQVGVLELDAAIDRVVAGLERKRRLTNPKERRLVAYHEAGHAIVAEIAPTADPVRKVSIIPRGSAALGYMQQTPEERHLLQEHELMDRLAVLLGGRAAEHVVFGQLSTGASNDLERATGLARRMVCEFGMSPAVGPVAFLAGQRAAATGDDGPWSEEATARIEAAVQGILTRAFESACGCLTERRSALDVVASALLERGSIDRDELRRLMSAA